MSFFNLFGGSDNDNADCNPAECPPMPEEDECKPDYGCDPDWSECFPDHGYDCKPEGSMCNPADYM